MANVQYYALTGGLNTVSSIATINQSNRRTESPDMCNVEFYKLGGLKSMDGNKRFSDTQFTSTVALGYEYILGNNKYLIVCTTDGKVFEYDKTADTFIEIYNFDRTTDRFSITAFNNGIVVSNGIDPFLYYKKGRRVRVGLATNNASSNIVTGKGTQFKTQLSVGDYIYFDEEEIRYVVEDVVSDTELKVTEVITTAHTETELYLGEISIVDAQWKVYADDQTTVESQRDIRGLAIQSYQGRIFVGAEDGTLYYSGVGLLNGWSTRDGGGAIESFYNDNSDFTALINWDRYLVLCKREYSYLLDGTSSDDTSWAIAPYSELTCESQQSYIISNNSLYMYAREAGGIFPLMQRTLYNSTYQGQELSLKIKDSFQYIDLSRLDEIYPVYHPKYRYIMFYIPLLTGIGSNYCYIYDIRTKTWILRRVTQDVTCAFRYNDKVYIGTRDGLVLEEFNGTSFDGEPIEFWWKSPWFNFSKGTDYLSTREIRLKLSEELSNNFTIRNYRDGKTDSKSRNIGLDSGVFKGLVWDIDDDSNSLTDTVWANEEGTSGDSWVVSSHQVKRFPIVDQYFNTLQIEFYGNSLDNGLALYGFEIDGIKLEEVPWS